ncbi:MAG: FtsX-like permease family protein [Syntrophomonas sp.]|nr:FtsX-like permease family protein [Syntrophomonas sp.]
MVMGILTRKIGRHILHNKGQFLAAAAVVMVGIITYIAMSSSYYYLSQSQDKFYRENNFADYYFQVVKAPQEIIKQVQMLPGVKSAGGRIQRDLSIIKKNEERATARVVSFLLPMEEQINQLTLVEGRMFAHNQQSSDVEVVLDPKFAAANNLAWGEQITVVVDNKEVLLTGVGSAISPEFIYTMKDSADILPDPQKFGIFMLENSQAQQVLNMPNQINQVLIKFSAAADQPQTIEAIKEILKPYGVLASYPRQDQLSHAVLQAELDGLRSVTIFLPLMFLGIAAAIQFVILRRMVKAQRLQIGVMKALGYNNYQIIAHYTSYALLVSCLGVVLGTVLGLILAGSISQVYAQFFNLPGGMQGYNARAIIYGFVLSLGVGTAAGVTAARTVSAIQPAQAMRAEPPKSSARSLVERWPKLWKRLNPGWKMTLRNVGRNRGRFALTLLGVVFAVGLLIISFFINDAVDYIMQRYFYEGQKYDLSIRFDSLLQEKELLSISRIDGVQKVEAFLELPVKMRYQGKTQDEVLLAYPPDLSMKKLESGTGKPIMVPRDGILINQRTAAKLGVKEGDEVELETLLTIGPIHRDTVQIIGETRQLIGGGSYIDLERANRILQERNLVSGAMLKIESGKVAGVESEINKMLRVSSILSRQKELSNFENNMASMAYSVSIMVLFAVILGFAIVYNSSVMNFSERQREIASLRVIGYSTREVSSLLLKENLLQSIFGVMLGLPFGRFAAEAYISSLSTDLYTLPVIIYPLTYLFSALGGIIFIMLAHRVAIKDIKDLDLVAALKQSD